MTKVSILSGIYSDMSPAFRASYPRNLMPIFVDNGISTGFLQTAQGIESSLTGPGVDRGGILWNGLMYRVMGSSLVSISANGVVSILGEIGPGGRVSLDYSFDRLIINSGIRLYYWQNATLTQVTDPDLGQVIDAIWIDGYTMVTDGTNIIVTELNDPTEINPLKYGSSEIDPDPIKGIIRLSNEVYVGNRYTIEVFDNVGGSGFPFARIDGALVEKGFVGTHAKCRIGNVIAFVGSGRNEQCAVYLCASGTAKKISTEDIDKVLAQYAENQLAELVMEARSFENHELIYIHLPGETLVYDVIGSQIAASPVWFSLHSGMNAEGGYRGRNFVYAYNDWWCGDTQSAAVGRLIDQPTQFGSIVGWRFDTTFLYNESKGAIINQMELEALTGRAELGRDPTIFASWTNDGLTWSNERTARAGKIGQYMQRVVWFMCGFFRHWRGLRFRGANDTRISFARLEVVTEGLNA